MFRCFGFRGQTQHNTALHSPGGRGGGGQLILCDPNGEGVFEGASKGASKGVSKGALKGLGTDSSKLGRMVNFNKKISSRTIFIKNHFHQKTPNPKDLNPELKT